MVEAVEILDTLQAHAYYLRNADDPAHDSLRLFQSSPLPTDGQDIPKNLLESKSIIDTVQTTQIKPSLPRRALSATQADQAEDTDLIDLEHRAYVKFYLSERRTLTDILVWLFVLKVARSNYFKRFGHISIQHLRDALSIPRRAKIPRLDGSRPLFTSPKSNTHFVLFFMTQFSP